MTVPKALFDRFMKSQVPQRTHEKFLGNDSESIRLIPLDKISVARSYLTVHDSKVSYYNQNLIFIALEKHMEAKKTASKEWSGFVLEDGVLGAVQGLGRAGKSVILHLTNGETLSGKVQQANSLGLILTGIPGRERHQAFLHPSSVLYVETEVNAHTE